MDGTAHQAVAWRQNKLYSGERQCSSAARNASDDQDRVDPDQGHVRCDAEWEEDKKAPTQPTR